MDPFAGVRCTGFVDGDYQTTYGIYPWVIALVMGNLMRSRFGQVVDGFFLGGRGRGRGDSRSPFNVVCFFSGRHEFPNNPFLCYILYIEYVPHIEDSEGADPSRSVTDSTEQWSPQESVTMFGYIEGSFLVNRTGDVCERHIPNIHRVRLYVI